MLCPTIPRFSPSGRKLEPRDTISFCSRVFFLLLILLLIPLRNGWSQSCERLTASGHPEFPPITWQEGNEITGVAADMARQIAGEINLPIEFPYTGPWKRVLAGLRAGTTDLIIAIYKTPDRVRQYDYAAPYIDDPVVIFTLTGKQIAFREWSDLTGHSGVTTRGDSWGQAFDNYIEQKLTVARVSDLKTVVRFLELARADYAIASLFTLEIHGKQIAIRGKVAVLPTPVSAEPVWIAFSKKSACRHLASIFATRLKEMRDDGTVNRLFRTNLDRHGSASMGTGSVTQ